MCLNCRGYRPGRPGPPAGCPISSMAAKFLFRRTFPVASRVIIRLGFSAPRAHMDRLQDVDPLETREWVDSLESVLEVEGPERAHFILEQLVDKARRSGAYLPYS